MMRMSTDELPDRRPGIAVPMVGSSLGSAEEDRRLAAEDRRRAASYLSASYRDATTGSTQPDREQMLPAATRDSSVAPADE